MSGSPKSCSKRALAICLIYANNSLGVTAKTCDSGTRFNSFAKFALHSNSLIQKASVSKDGWNKMSSMFLTASTGAASSFFYFLASFLACFLVSASVSLGCCFSSSLCMFVRLSSGLGLNLV